MTRLRAVNIILRRAGLGEVTALGGGQNEVAAASCLDESLIFVQSWDSWGFNRRSNASLYPSLFTDVTAAWTVANKRLTATGLFVNSAVGQTIAVTSPISLTAKVVARTDNWIEIDGAVDAGDIGGVVVSSVDGQIKLTDAQFIFVKSYGQDNWRKITSEGRKLFDLDENTDIFSGPVKVTYRTAFDIGCLPEPVALVVAESAAQLFIETCPRADRSLYQAAVRALTNAKAAAMSFDSAQMDVNVFTNRSGFGDRPPDPSVSKFR
jgi:hypothetical protein